MKYRVFPGTQIRVSEVGFGTWTISTGWWGEKSDAEDLLKHADLAMYRAKTDGGNVVRFYAADMHSRAQEARHLDSELRQAVEDNQFVVYYQPQVELKTGHIVGAEALLRWRRPGRGIVGPSEFLARAEENGLIVPINEWVLRQACRDAKSWQRAGYPPLRVGVNLSAVQLGQTSPHASGSRAPAAIRRQPSAESDCCR